MYAVKNEQADEWVAYDNIAGFEAEKGYEYKIKVNETNSLTIRWAILHGQNAICSEVISKVQKDSEGLPYAPYS